MRFLRRSTPTTVGADSSADPSTDTAQGPGEPARSTGKGRPTPKRREAETKRRGPAPPPPRTQREAARLAKANRPDKSERRRAAAIRREGMASGDEKFLMPRDRGPVKAYIRDVVDSRPHLMGLFMPLAIVVVISTFIPAPAAQQYMSLFSFAALASMLLEGVLLGISTTKAVRARFPEEKIGGFRIGSYASMRAIQLRRLRLPKPRVARGANP